MARKRNAPDDDPRRPGIAQQGRDADRGGWGDEDNGRRRDFGPSGDDRYPDWSGAREREGGLGPGGMGQRDFDREERGYGFGYGGGEGPRGFGSRTGGAGVFAGAYGSGGPAHGHYGGLGERGMGERSGGDAWARQDNRHQRGVMERAGDEIASWFGDDDATRRREADHRGKGPKGYRRSDDRIREDVNDHLSDDPGVDASDIEVSVENGEVTLSGLVSSRQEKRRAEDCVERVSGIGHVQNNLRVRAEGETQASPGDVGASGGAAHRRPGEGSQL